MWYNYVNRATEEVRIWRYILYKLKTSKSQIQPRRHRYDETQECRKND